jgi:hypothetical protein
VLTRVEPEPIQTSKQEWRFGSVLLDAGALSDEQLRAAAELLAHLNEASFGYRSGIRVAPTRANPASASIPAEQRSAIDGASSPAATSAPRRSCSAPRAGYPTKRSSFATTCRPSAIGC